LLGEVGQYEVATNAIENVVTLSSSNSKMASRFVQAGIFSSMMPFFCDLNNLLVDGTLHVGKAIITLLNSYPKNIEFFIKVVDWKLLKNVVDQRKGDGLKVTIDILSILAQSRDSRYIFIISSSIL
jgi:hypothetical protein